MRAPHLLSYRHKKSELSMEAHARLISGKSPQKHIVWQERYLSCTMAGRSNSVGDRDRKRLGHCDSRTSWVRLSTKSPSCAAHPHLSWSTGQCSRDASSNTHPLDVRLECLLSPRGGQQVKEVQIPPRIVHHHLSHVPVRLCYLITGQAGAGIARSAQC